jgi:hypothetical protein
MSNELTQTTLTLDQWLVERDKVVGQVKRLVKLWFLNKLGTRAELSRHLDVHHSTVSGHVDNLVLSGELPAEYAPVKRKSPATPSRENREPVENSTPTYVAPATTVFNPPINVSNTEYTEPVLVSATVVDDDAEQDYERCLEHIDAIIALTKKYFHSGWDKRKWYELAGECRTIEACCTNHCGSEFGAGSQRSSG